MSVCFAPNPLTLARLDWMFMKIALIFIREGGDWSWKTIEMDRYVSEIHCLFEAST